MGEILPWVLPCGHLGEGRWRDGHVSMSGGAWSTRKTGGNILLENGKGGEPPRWGASPEERQELEAGVPNHGHQTPCWEERAPRTGLGRQKGQAGNDPYII